MKQKLKKLLDSYIYRKANDGKYYTARETFEKQYVTLISDGGIERHFALMIDEEIMTQSEAKEELDKLRSEVHEEGLSLEEIAYNMIEDELNLLDGGTVDLKEAK